MQKRYDAGSIEVHMGLDGVRKHPSMYLGGLEARGTFQLFKEIADNGLDELKEFGKDGRLKIELDVDSVTIADNGRGIPTDVHPKTKLTGVETVMTMLHAGAKSGAKTAYGKDTIGVHGVGASVVNALSSTFQVWTFRDRAWWTIKFAKGKTVSKLAKGKPPLAWPKGTVVRYARDKTIMPEPLDVEMVKAWCDINRYFAPVPIHLAAANGRSIDYVPRPPESLLKKRIAEVGGVAVSPVFHLVAPGVKLVAAWTGLTDTHVFSSVSGSPTTGGTHVKGLELAVAEAFASVVKKMDGADPMVGLVVAMDVSVDQPSFAGQAKTRLETKAARNLVLGAVKPALIKWLKANKDAATSIVEHARVVTKMNDDIANRKTLAKDSRQTQGGRVSLPKGFVSARSYPPDRRELYIVEGESAGGTAKDARMPYQEVLKLRGKLPNITREPGKVLTNDTIRNIVCVTGYDPRSPTKRLQVGKIILLADADDDGQHIEVLLLNILVSLMPDAFAQGRIYIVRSPLFEAMSNGKQVHGDTIASMEKAYGKVNHVHRMKGWGSCGAPLLHEVAMNPETRQLARIMVPTAKDAKEFAELMGKDTDARKSLMGL